jgi:predicted DNA-binding transcriptional regulator AlpA
MNGARSLATNTRLTPKQVAELVGRSERTLWFWRKKKSGPAYVRIERQGYYPVDAFNEWLKSQEWA